MKKFSFSLEKLRGYKDSLLDREKGKLAQLNAHLHAIEDRIDNAYAQMRDYDEQRQEKARNGTNVNELRLYAFHIENTRLLIDQLKKERMRAERDAEKQRIVVLQLSQEVSGLDKLKEKQLEAYNYAAMQEQQVVVGEIVASKYAAQAQAG